MYMSTYLLELKMEIVIILQIEKEHATKNQMHIAQVLNSLLCNVWINPNIQWEIAYFPISK